MTRRPPTQARQHGRLFILSLQQLKTGKKDGHEHGEKDQTQSRHRPGDKCCSGFRRALFADQGKHAVGHDRNRQSQKEWTQAHAEPRERRWRLRPMRRKIGNRREHGPKAKARETERDRDEDVCDLFHAVLFLTVVPANRHKVHCRLTSLYVKCCLHRATLCPAQLPFSFLHFSISIFSSSLPFFLLSL